MDLDDVLLNRAIQLTHIDSTNALLALALTRLIESEASRGLAELGGTDPAAEPGPRGR